MLQSQKKNFFEAYKDCISLINKLRDSTDPSKVERLQAIQIVHNHYITSYDWKYYSRRLCLQKSLTTYLSIMCDNMDKSKTYILRLGKKSTSISNIINYHFFD